MPRKRKQTLDIPLLEIIIEALQEKKGTNIVSLELAKLPGSICEHFVICTANAHPHVESLFNSVCEEVKKQTGLNVWHTEGLENAEWVLIDYFDVVVHIFQQESREFYQLEDLWADAPLTTY
jgi:ribosome-associated protein